MNAIKQILYDRFHLHEASTTILQEFTAAASTFLALIYIFIVNPAVLGRVGLDPTRVLLATIVVSGIATILMGLLSRSPLALAPGMEMNGYFVFILVGTLHFAKGDALVIVVMCGVLFLIMNATGLRIQLMEQMQQTLVHSFAICMGFFLMAIGFSLAGIIDYNNPNSNFVRFVSLGEGPKILDTWIIFGLSVVLILSVDKILKMRGAIVIGVLFTSILSVLWELPKDNLSFDWSRVAEFDLKFDPSILLNPSAWVAIFSLFVIDFFGSLAKILGVTHGTALDVRGDTSRIRLKKALYVDAGATIAGGFLGTSNVTVYIESKVGIDFGGKTGLTAVFCGIMMLLMLFAIPVLALVPELAAAGVLVYVGILIVEVAIPRMIQEQGGLFELSLVLLMGFFIVAYLSLDRAIAVGLVGYALLSVYRGETDWFLMTSSIVMLLALLLQTLLI